VNRSFYHKPGKFPSKDGGQGWSIASARQGSLTSPPFEKGGFQTDIATGSKDTLRNSCLRYVFTQIVSAESTLPLQPSALLLWLYLHLMTLFYLCRFFTAIKVSITALNLIDTTYFCNVLSRDSYRLIFFSLYA